LAARAKLIRKELDLLSNEDIAATGIINPQFTRFALSVRPSKIHRFGVFTEERIPAGVEVIEYTGEKIRLREANRRASFSVAYVFRLNKQYCLDGAVGGSGAEYFNHCCDPNLRTKIVDSRIIYVSQRPIKPGEELTIDYNFPADAEKTPCHCGSPNCRGTLNRIDDRPTRVRRAVK
jgi:SET domain-containing protein